MVDKEAVLVLSAGKRFWKVVRKSSSSGCSFDEVVEKLERTSNGAYWNSTPGLLGFLRILLMSFDKEYSVILKNRVGPRGVRAIRSVGPLED